MKKIEKNNWELLINEVKICNFYKYSEELFPSNFYYF